MIHSDFFIPGYDLLSVIYSRPPLFVFDAIRLRDTTRLVIKYLQVPSHSDRANALEREYDILKSLHIDGIVKALSLETVPNGVAMMLEHVGTSTLKTMIANHPLPIDQFLSLAIKCCETVGYMHQQNIIHKDIKPENIIINHQDNRIKLTDFGIATRVLEAFETESEPSKFQGTLLYISPEQTGRINRIVDYRTDIYSLGAVFYEMLTGQAMFETDDSVALIYAHIATQPVPVSVVNSQVPEVISQIVMKCLAKDSEDRYQNCFGMMQDLKKCQMMLLDAGEISDFEIAHYDIPFRLTIPHVLVGRNAEIAALDQSFERVCAGGRELMLVNGVPGIGKTALILEVKRPILQKKGYFISGKFDQYSRDVPYSAIVAAIQQLISRLLTEAEAVLEQFRSDFKEHVGENGQVILDVVPDLALIVGPQPPLPRALSEEAHNRFLMSFKQFIQILATPAHPLVMFLDDLQWADVSSLALLEMILTTTDIGYCLVLGTYRSNDPKDLIYLLPVIQTIEAAQTPITTLNLGNLTEADCHHLLKLLIRKERPFILPLSRILLAKTSGNPFFIQQFITALYAEKLLMIDEQFSWICDLEQVQKMKVTDNVVDLLLARISRLPDSIQEKFHWMACFGKAVNISDLCGLLNTQESDIMDELTIMMNEGLICRAGNALSFVHDRIQEACYSRIPQTRYAVLHHHIGQYLLASTRQGTMSVDSVTIVSHLNQGLSLISDPEELLALARMNRDAGQQARVSAAYQSALGFCKQGIALLSESSWHTHYELMFSLHVLAVECTHFCSLFEEMDAYYQVVMAHAASVLDQVQVSEIRIEAYWAQKDLPGTIRLGLKTLALLGVHLPEHPGLLRTAFEFLQSAWLMRGRKVKALLNLPPMTDPRMLAVMRLLSLLSSAAYWSNTELLNLIILRQCKVSIRYGNCKASCFGWIAYGLSYWKMHRYHKAYEFGSMALELLDKLEARDQACRIIMVFNAFFRSYKDPMQLSHLSLKLAYQIGLDNGDFEFAAHCLMIYSMQNIFCSTSLDQAEGLLRRNLQACRSLNQQSQADMLAIGLQTVLSVSGKCRNLMRVKGEFMDEDAMLPVFAERRANSLINALPLYSGIINVVFLNWEQAVHYLARALATQQAQIATIHYSFLFYFDALARLNLMPAQTRSEQRQHMAQVKSHLRKIRRWAKAAPSNYAHQYHLLLAELARVENRDAEAVFHYQKSIDSAHLFGWRWNEATAYECAARFYQGRIMLHQAALCMTQAERLYRQWGAWAKVQQLQDNYMGLILREESTLAQTGNVTYAGGNQTGFGAVVDYQTLIRSSQSISTDIQIDRLLENLIRNITENAGAQKAVLLLRKTPESSLKVEAVRDITVLQNQVMCAIPLTAYPEICHSIVAYVERTKQCLIIGDAVHHDQFGLDPYIMAHRPQSILCAPIVSKDQVKGIMYLENNLSTNVFSEDHKTAVTILAGQAAIAIENALLYQEQLNFNKRLQQRVVEKTSELKHAMEEAERANEFKSRFLAQMTHDLRTPLHVILGTLDRLRGIPDVQERPGILAGVELAFRSAERQLLLVNDVLDFGKIESGKMDFITEVMPVAEFLQEFEAVMVPLLKNKPVQFILESSLPSDLVIEADKQRLGQIITNLLGNAAKFTKSGTIRLQVSLLSRESRKGVLEFSVIDTGMGMSQEAASRIFDEYAMVKNGFQKNVQGTGLGLTIAKQLIEGMGGTISVTSVPDQGTTFVLTLPCVVGETE